MIYADGQLIGFNNVWDETITVIIPETTTIVAVKIKNKSAAGGLLGSFSDGSVTDGSWQCTSTIASDQWTSSTFDDSSWPNALATEGQGGKWQILLNVAINAKWILAGTSYTFNESTSNTAYCRKKIPRHTTS